jgi:hypothetical protein
MRPSPHLVSGGSLRRNFPVPGPAYSIPLDDDDGDDDDLDEVRSLPLPDVGPSVATLPPPTEDVHRVSLPLTVLSVARLHFLLQNLVI